MLKFLPLMFLKSFRNGKKNAFTNEVNVVFMQRDILKTEDLEQNFDLIVSNPPYVRNLEKDEIKKNVLEYEPHLALFVEDDDALLFTERFLNWHRKT